MDQRLTQTPYKSLLIATDDLRRGLAQYSPALTF